jgi:hypothetical protein
LKAEEKESKQKTSTKQAVSREDGSDMFLQNIGRLSLDYRITLCYIPNNITVLNV